MIKYRLHISPVLMTFVVIISIALTGCSKEWFEEKPDRLMVVPETLDDFQGLMDDLFMAQQYPVLGEIASDLHYIPAERYQFMPKSPSTDAYIWSRTMRHEKVGDWYRSYEKVLRDNVVLDGLAEIEPGAPGETEKWRNIKGQALFNRARVFFEVAQTYCPRYSEGTASKDLGVVLKMSSDITAASKRSTVKETFKTIIKDLEEAESLLPETQVPLTRPSKTSTNFLLARIYLYMGNYAKALEHIEKSLAVNAALLDFSKLSASDLYIGRYNAEVILHSNFIDNAITSAAVSSDFLNSYSDGDLRKEIFYMNTFDGSISFKGNYESVTIILFNGFATDEAYLIRAECKARMKDITGAMEDLNTLLKSRWSKDVTYVDLTASNEEEALIFIINERKKELNYRGVRWMDLKRLGDDARFVQTITKVVEGQTYSIEPNSYKYTFPVPDDVIELSGVKQNVGWER